MQKNEIASHAVTWVCQACEHTLSSQTEWVGYTGTLNTMEMFLSQSHNSLHFSVVKPNQSKGMQTT